MKRSVIVVVALAAVIVVALLAGFYLLIIQDWRRSYLTYTNSRYGFSVGYPKNWTLKDPPPNNDGREMHSPDGRILCRAYGFANALTGDSGEPQTLDEYISWIIDNSANEDSGVDFELVKREETILGGKRGVHILAQEAQTLTDTTYTLNNETGYGVACSYPQELRDKNKYVFDHMVESFKITGSSLW